jgi:hypothetical protein
MTDFAALLAALARHEVAFIVVGGAAAIAHGSARLTQDLDIVYERSPANLDRLVEALADQKPSTSWGRLREADRTTTSNHRQSSFASSKRGACASACRN